MSASQTSTHVDDCAPPARQSSSLHARAVYLWQPCLKFPAAAVSAWNILMKSVQASPSLSVFRSRLKTELFARPCSTLWQVTLYCTDYSVTLLCMCMLLRVLAVIGLQATIKEIRSPAPSSSSSSTSLSLCQPDTWPSGLMMNGITCWINWSLRVSSIVYVVRLMHGFTRLAITSRLDREYLWNATTRYRQSENGVENCHHSRIMST